MVEFLSTILTTDNVTTTGHVLIVSMVLLLYRRLNILERQLIIIAANTGTLAAMFEVKKAVPEPEPLDGREP
jgi:hypothetical protein